MNACEYARVRTTGLQCLHYMAWQTQVPLCDIAQVKKGWLKIKHTHNSRFGKAGGGGGGGEALTAAKRENTDKNAAQSVTAAINTNLFLSS